VRNRTARRHGAIHDTVADYSSGPSVAGDVRRSADHVALGVTATDGREGLFLVVRTGSRELGRGTLVRLPGLEADLQYRVAAPGPLSRSVEGSLAPALRDGKLLMNGAALASRGLDLFLPRPETSLLLHVKAA
jgi:hypothetical protein